MGTIFALNEDAVSGAAARDTTYKADDSAIIAVVDKSWCYMQHAGESMPQRPGRRIMLNTGQSSLISSSCDRFGKIALPLISRVESSVHYFMANRRAAAT